MKLLSWVSYALDFQLTNAKWQFCPHRYSYAVKVLNLIHFKGRYCSEKKWKKIENFQKSELCVAIFQASFSKNSCELIFEGRPINILGVLNQLMYFGCWNYIVENKQFTYAKFALPFIALSGSPPGRYSSSTVVRSNQKNGNA